MYSKLNSDEEKQLFGCQLVDDITLYYQIGERVRLRIIDYASLSNLISFEGSKSL